MAVPLRLFTSPSAFPNPQRLRLFLHEKGIADQFEERVYDMTPGGEQRQWPHLKMNPWGETPTLELPDGSTSCRDRRHRPLSRPGLSPAKNHGRNPVAAGSRHHVEQPHLGAYPLPDRHRVPCPTSGARTKARTDHQSRLGRALPQRGAGACGLVNQHLSDGRDWMLGGRRTDLLRHHDGDRDRLLQVSPQRHPARRALRTCGCVLASAGSFGRVSRPPMPTAAAAFRSWITSVN
jgi:glutathione S-transferase